MSILVGKTRYESGYTGLTHQYLDVERIQDTLYYIINRKGNQFGAMRNLSSAYMGVSSRNLFGLF